MLAISVGCLGAPWAQADVPPILITGTLTSPGSQPIVIGQLTGQNSCTFTEVAASNGPVDASISNDGVNWTAATISNMAGTSESQPFTPTGATTYQISPTNAAYVEVGPDSTWSTQKAAVTLRCSASVSSYTVTPAPATTGNQPVSCISPGCVVVMPSGVAVNSEPPPVQPSPLYTVPVTTPAPCVTAASPAPSGVCASAITGVSGASLPLVPIACNNGATGGIPVSIALPSATTTILATAPPAGESFYFCGFVVQLGSNSVTFQLGYWNGLQCAALTPAMSGSTAIVALTTFASIQAPAGNAPCAKTTGAGASATGFAPFTVF